MSSRTTSSQMSPTPGSDPTSLSSPSSPSSLDGLFPAGSNDASSHAAPSHDDLAVAAGILMGTIGDAVGAVVDSVLEGEIVEPHGFSVHEAPTRP